MVPSTTATRRGNGRSHRSAGASRTPAVLDQLALDDVGGVVRRLEAGPVELGADGVAAPCGARADRRDATTKPAPPQPGDATGLIH